jgi:NhaP-type Na+/H+ or K+/H+ antiporter
MSYLGWMTLVGAVLLVMALSSAYIKRLPITTGGLYLTLGVALSPAWLSWIRIDLVAWSEVIERLTEVAVLVSLFVSGLKLRLPLRDIAWTAAYRLAGPVMLASIAGVALLAHFALELSWPVSFLLGALLAPTDPVLASEVSVNHAADHDRVRYGLTGEAGLNDGAAFPFVIFALTWIDVGRVETAWALEWVLHRIVWAVPAGLFLGYVLGQSVAKVAIRLRSRHAETNAPNDFLALALIALTYAGAEVIHAWGFLAVFAAGIGFRRAEKKALIEHPVKAGRVTRRIDNSMSLEATASRPAEEVLLPRLDESELRHPAKAAGVVVSDILSFGETAERLLEVLMVVLIGICLAFYWDWRGAPIALGLFFVIRPLATFVFLLGTGTAVLQRMVMAWFGIRGIGSIYYLSYSLNHSTSAAVEPLIGVVLVTVALSILLHGLSSQPILRIYESAIKSRGNR